MVQNVVVMLTDLPSWCQFIWRNSILSHKSQAQCSQCHKVHSVYLTYYTEMCFMLS